MTSALNTQQQWTFDGYGYPLPPKDHDQYPADRDPRLAQRFNPRQGLGQEYLEPSGGPQPTPAPVVTDRLRIDQGRFWVGAALTAAVAGLAAVIGLVVAQDLLRVPVSLSAIGLPGAHIGSYGLVVALVALLGAVAFNGMIAFAPRPTVYYGTLVGLLTALAVLMPFTASGPLSAQVALAGINLVIGILIMALVPLAAISATSRS